jgi:hypothetical protein
MLIVALVLAVATAGCTTTNRRAATQRMPGPTVTTEPAPSTGAATTSTTTGATTAAVAQSTGAATTSTTTRATTTGTSTASLPLAPACNPGQHGSGVRPALIFIGCATSADYVSRLKWTSWTTTTATATALHNVDSCKPNCAQGTYSHFAVRVTLWDPGVVDGVLVFRRMSARPTTSVGSPETATVPPGPATGPDWGWLPNTAN